MVIEWITALLVGAASSAQPAPVFETASIQEAPPIHDGVDFHIGCSGGPGTPTPKKYTCNHSDLSALIRQAYDLEPYQIAPYGSAGSAHFTVRATLSEEATRPQVRLMLRNLLAERFKLTWHYEKKEVPAYELTVAKGGARRKESRPDLSAAADGAPTSSPVAWDDSGFPIPPRQSDGGFTISTRNNGLARLDYYGATMVDLAKVFTQQLGRPVTDATGLTGRFDVSLTFLSPLAPLALPSGTASDPGGISLFEAVQKYLGLKLEPARRTVDVFVIDHAEKKPTEN